MLSELYRIAVHTAICRSGKTTAAAPLRSRNFSIVALVALEMTFAAPSSLRRDVILFMCP